MSVEIYKPFRIRQSYSQNFSIIKVNYIKALKLENALIPYKGRIKEICLSALSPERATHH